MAINLASGARWTMDVSGNFQSADRAGDSVTDSSSRRMLMSHELGVIAARTISVVRSALAPPKGRFELNRSCPHPRRFLRPDVLTPCLSPDRDRQTESGRLDGNDKDLSKGMRPPVIGHLTAACRLGRLNGDGHRPRRSETMRDQNTGDGRRFPDAH